MLKALVIFDVDGTLIKSINVNPQEAQPSFYAPALLSLLLPL